MTLKVTVEVIQWLDPNTVAVKHCTQTNVYLLVAGRAAD